MSAPERQDDERLALFARIDELMMLKASLARALARSRVHLAAPLEAVPSEASIVAALDQIAKDLDSLRLGIRDRELELDQRSLEIDTLHREIVSLRDACGALRNEISSAHKERVQIERELAEAKGAISDWRRENEAVARHRDAVIATLIAVQESRWMRLGRRIRIVRGHGDADAG